MIILFDSDYKEIGPVEVDLDAEYGTDSENDFEMVTNAIQTYNPYGFYVEGTEVGGIFEYVKSITDTDIQTLCGYTWRGLMNLSLILPPSGSDYNIVSGEANTIVKSFLDNIMGGLFVTSTEDSGLTITSYQFPLYVTTLKGLEGMLEKYGYRLSLEAKKINGQIRVFVECVEATVVSGAYNEDSDVPMTFEVDNMGINHLVCAGQGQLQDREIVHLYIDNTGEISQTQYYTGFDERTEFYDYSSAQSTDDLVDNGTKKLKELASSKVLEIGAPDEIDLEVGDLVKGVFPDGTIITSPVVSKVYKISKGMVSTSFKIKGEN